MLLDIYLRNKVDEDLGFYPTAKHLLNLNDEKPISDQIGPDIPLPSCAFTEDDKKLIYDEIMKQLSLFIIDLKKEKIEFKYNGDTKIMFDFCSDLVPCTVGLFDEEYADKILNVIEKHKNIDKYVRIKTEYITGDHSEELCVEFYGKKNCLDCIDRNKKNKSSTMDGQIKEMIHDNIDYPNRGMNCRCCIVEKIVPVENEKGTKIIVNKIYEEGIINI